ncbi:MAG TPA: glucose-1-phosphate adenylyltransferase [Clostridia bacterium]|nr:glucose-1-phosphate adenylyltransferase [Clostridia bacterium]
MIAPQPFLPFGTHNVLAVILGGGQGSRLFPLTKDRAKPAVPLGGKYRLVDIPISNCINSGLVRIFLLTQFNSASLHRHISQSYKFDHFSAGFVEILAAEQTLTDASWYQGTADAVRKNLIHFQNNPFDYMLILSGDQLYRMDYRTILDQHVASKADITVSTLPVLRKSVPGFGIMKMASDYRITEFVEKPKDPTVQDAFRLPREWYPKLKIKSDDELFLASMGIYVFNREALFELLRGSSPDFGKHVIPQALNTHRVCAYVFQGAWEDIGTIRNFFDCNLELTDPLPRFNIFDMTAPVFTRPRFLPSSKINGGNIELSLLSDGCIIDHSTIRQTVLGLRSVLRRGSHLQRVVVMGNDFYEPAEAEQRHRSEGLPLMGIGENTRIENAIIDKNARVGRDCVISPAGKPKDVDHALYYVRDGIVIIPKNGVVPDGTVI